MLRGSVVHGVVARVTGEPVTGFPSARSRGIHNERTKLALPSNVLSAIWLSPSGGDDTTAINAANSVNRMLGPGTFLISGAITLPVGQGPGQTTVKATSSAGRIQQGPNLGTLPTVDAGTYGNFTFDGNSLTSTACALVNVSSASLLPMVLKNGLSDGFVYGGQNCTAQLNIGGMGGCGLVWDNGCGGGWFPALKVSRCAQRSLEIRQSVAPPAGAFAVPSFNYVIGGVLEYGSGANLGMVHQLAGSWNYLLETTFYTPLNVSQILLEPNTAPGRSGDPNGRLYLRNPSFTGGGVGTGQAIEANVVSGGVAGALNTDVAVIIQGDAVYSGLANGIKWGTSSPIYRYSGSDWRYSGTSAVFVTNGAGAFAAPFAPGQSAQTFPDDIVVNRDLYLADYLQGANRTAALGGFAAGRARLFAEDLAGDGSRQGWTSWQPDGSRRVVARQDLPGLDELAPLASQNGVTASADCALSATSMAGGTGVLTYTLAAATYLWVKKTTGVLTPVKFAGVTGGTLTPAVLPASGQYHGYGIEVDTNGAVSLSTGGTDQATQALALANINTLAANGKLRVADIIILNTAGVYTLDASRDRRPWAKGFFNKVRRTTDISLTGVAAMQVIDATNLQMRVETTTGQLRCFFRSWFNNAVANGNLDLAVFVDGVIQGDVECFRASGNTTNVNVLGIVSWDITSLGAGSHLLAPAWANPNGGGSIDKLFGNSAPAQGMSFTVEEIVRPNANNGTS